MTTAPQLINQDSYETKFGFFDKDEALFKSKRGLTPEIVNMISDMKDEPEWMRKFRLRALELFRKKENPTWASTNQLNDIDFDNIRYFVRATDRDERSWEDVPEYIRNTFDKLGIPEIGRAHV